MRYCNQCYRITSGEPLFCNFCGRSYDVKLCPHRHPNPRNAEICSQCGSRELSTPHPRVPLWLSATFTLLTALPGVLLLAFTVAFFFAFVDAMTTNPQAQGQFLVAGLMLALVWYLYIHLPQAIKRSMTKLFRRSGGNHGDGHGH